MFSSAIMKSKPTYMYIGERLKQLPCDEPGIPS